jgi:beta-glucanase (GH16 family)
VITYPVAFYLDIAGVLIGISDYAFDRQHWRAVARAPQHTVEEAASYADALSPVLDIRTTWRLTSSVPTALLKVIPTMNKPARWIPWLVLAGTAAALLGATRASRLPVSDAHCRALEHDGDPWIVHPARLHGYCDGDAPGWTRRSSRFDLVRKDTLDTLDPAYWDKMDSTFFCNEAAFSPDNIVPGTDGGVAMVIQPGDRHGRSYTAGDLATKDTDEANFLYGRFETTMKPARGSGIISAMFLYRFDPWQEIDTEFLGKDTTKIMLNVYYNPGEDGDLYNYGYRGTPVLIDLGFDAADDFHTYAVEWDVDEIRWFVDDVLIHKRTAGRPTPIPHLPMRLHMNAWPMCSEELVGAFDGSELPVQAEFRSIAISSMRPAAFSRLLSLIDPPATRKGQWQDDAEWIQP